VHESNCKVMHCSAWKGYIEKDLFMQVISIGIFNHILHSVICMICNFQVKQISHDHYCQIVAYEVYDQSPFTMLGAFTLYYIS
jgi:hypothetical protein